jgi:hypothetical protein
MLAPSQLHLREARLGTIRNDKKIKNPERAFGLPPFRGHGLVSYIQLNSDIFRYSRTSMGGTSGGHGLKTEHRNLLPTRSF